MDDRIDIIRRRILEDRSSGAAKSLAEYADLFPGEDTLVARAYADVYGTVASSPAPSDSDTIGQYRILKELGRGGQGVVYLAEDTRLHRKVALKVLTGLGPGSEDSVHRLRREAEVASKLEHPGICGVHDAGVANGTPYIAMHYVEGTTLAERISATRSLATAGEPSSVVMLSEAPETGSPTESVTRSPATTALTTKQEIPEILRVFEKAAVALHAAHEAGIVHRDIKPGNIMVTAGGQPVILDFGLARAEDMDLQTLTRTGDVFGTPAYMSPEQISGQRIRLDRRSDVYSLGVTLYECLTLRRPFEAPTREGVYQAVMTKSPPDPRNINPAISKDLKVVIETALEKDRDRRYATADALARDLEAVLDSRPIQARPVGPVGRFVRWSKREPAKAALLGVLFVALPVIATLVTSHLKDRPQVEAARRAEIEQEKDEILAEASHEVSEGDSTKAVALYTQVLEMEGSSPEAVGGLVLAHLKLKNATVALQLLDRYKPMLADGAAAYLLRADTLSTLGRKKEAEALINVAPSPRSAFEHHLLAEKERQNGAAGERAAYGRALSHVTTAILLSPAPRISLYTLRATVAGATRDRATAVETAAALRHLWPDSASAQSSRGFALARTGDRILLDEAIAAWRESIRLNPDLGAHANLANALIMKGLIDEAIAVCREGIRRSPNNGFVHMNLGTALSRKGLHDEAIAECREAIRLSPGSSWMYGPLGNALVEKGLLEEGIAALREAIRLDPNDATSHAALGRALSRNGRLDDAIGAYRQAVRLAPHFAVAHHNLGSVQFKKGLIDDAIASGREAIRCDPDYADAYRNLATFLKEKGLVDDAIAAAREAIRLNPNDPKAHKCLGDALQNKGVVHDAIAAYREAIRLNPNDADTQYNFAISLVTIGLIDEAVAAYREAIRVKPDYAEAHCNLAGQLGSLGQLRESLAEYRRGHELGSEQPGWRYPSEQWVADAQQRVDDEQELEAQLAGHVAAGTQPEGTSELVALARVALNQGRPALAARWFHAAFEKAPDHVEAIDAGHRRMAARAAVLASIGGTDSAPAPDDVARATWRVRGLAWLEAELADVKEASEAARLKAPQVRIALVPLTRHADLAAVREKDAIARLPQAEQVRWTKLWADIDALLSSIDRKPESRTPETKR